MPGSMFCTDQGVAQLPVPGSCIESAEYVIQCLANNNRHHWHVGQTVEPHVLAKFGNTTFNISEEPNFHRDSRCLSLTDHAFNGLPQLGQGIILLNKTAEEGNPYNMHLGAVVATCGTKTRTTKIYLTDVSEQRDSAVVMVDFTPRACQSINDFRGFDYPSARFAIGLLETR